MIVSRSGSGGSAYGAVAFDSGAIAADAAIIDSLAIIPGTGSLLVAYFRARTDEAVAVSTLLVRANADAGASYDRVLVTDTNAAVSGGNVLAANSWTVNCAGNTATAGVFSHGEAAFLSYATAANPKTGRAINGVMDQTAANTQTTLYALGYRSAAAISRLSIAPGGGTVLRAGSRLYVVVY